MNYTRDIKYHCLLFAGDQLTIKLARSAGSQCDNLQHAQGKLRGFVPVAQDCSALTCLICVRWTITFIGAMESIVWGVSSRQRNPSTTAASHRPYQCTNETKAEHECCIRFRTHCDTWSCYSIGHEALCNSIYTWTAQKLWSVESTPVPRNPQKTLSHCFIPRTGRHGRGGRKMDQKSFRRPKEAELWCQIMWRSMEISQTH